jgi:PIN domain nuclease of toxin-antitoxin system
MNEGDGILLDTHAWLWLATGDAIVPAAVRKTLEKIEARGGLYVSAISLLEIANMARRNRIQLPVNLNEWFERALSEANIGLLPITPEIAAETAVLPESFQGDPADRLIAATARVESLTLCTHDKDLLRFAKTGLFRALIV